MKRLLNPAIYLTLLVIVLTVSGCNSSLGGFEGFATAEEAVRDEHRKMSSVGIATQGFTIVATRTFGNRALVFSTESSLGDSLFNTYIVIRPTSGWSLYSMTGQEGDKSPPPPALACGIVTTGTDEIGSFASVYGRTEAAKVARVEVDLVSGQTLTDTTKDGVFAVMASSHDRPIELRLVDVNEQILYSMPISQPSSPRIIPSNRRKAATSIANQPFGGIANQPFGCVP